MRSCFNFHLVTFIIKLITNYYATNGSLFKILIHNGKTGKMEILEKLRNKMPRQLLIQLPRIINFELFRNVNKKLEELKYFSRISFKILDFVKANVIEGMTEQQIERLIRKLGKKCHLTVIPLLVSSGENTAKVHGYATGREIQENDIVMIDIGLKKYLFSNCTSDITRTFFLGTPTPLQQKIYDIVKTAHDKAIKMIKPCVNAFLIDKMVRKYLKNFQFEMPHGLGHGTGTRYPHNIPMLSNKYQNFILKENDIITIEPGVYLPGKFGIRIEDMVLVTKDGYEIISLE
jgi:Xaa-Pro aminopeptidase